LVVAVAGIGAVTFLLAAPRVRAWWSTVPATPPPHIVGPGDVANPFTIVQSFSPSALDLRHPLGLAIGPDGNIYVTDGKTQTVSVISPDGQLLRRWGGPGTHPGQFRLGHGAIAVGSDGDVYVADSGNFRVQVFSSTGTFLRQFGTFGTGRGQFQWPFDLEVDDRGNVYVSDDRSATVSRFSPSGEFVWRFGGPATGIPDLVGHEHLASTDARGHVVLANDDRGRIIYLTAGGHEVDSFGDGDSGGQSMGTFPSTGDFPGGACNVTVNSVGVAVVNSCDEASAPSHDTVVFDSTHRLIGAWLGSPFAMSPRFGPNGEIFVLSYDGSILRLTMSTPGQ
jgi:DNA-binding beta-propeller fold protein YncE